MPNKFEYMYVSYRIGQGTKIREMTSPWETNKIVDLHINGNKEMKYATIDQFYNAMGEDGWEVKGFQMNKDTIFYTIFQRQIF